MIPILILAEHRLRQAATIAAGLLHEAAALAVGLWAPDGRHRAGRDSSTLQLVDEARRAREAKANVNAARPRFASANPYRVRSGEDHVPRTWWAALDSHYTWGGPVAPVVHIGAGRGRELVKAA